MARIGIVAEAPGETRVAATPSTVPKLIGLGYEVVVEAGAGAGILVLGCGIRRSRGDRRRPDARRGRPRWC